MYRIEWWTNNNEYHNQRTYTTKKMFRRYLLEYSSGNGDYYRLKIYQVVNGEWQQLNHKNGIII